MFKVGFVCTQRVWGKGALKLFEDCIYHVISTLEVALIHKVVFLIPIKVSKILSASQIRAARALLGWSGKDLAALSGVGITTIRRYELQEGIPAGSTSVLATIKAAFEGAGIRFTGDPLSNPGVTLDLSTRGGSDE